MSADTIGERAPTIIASHTLSGGMRLVASLGGYSTDGRALAYHVGAASAPREQYARIAAEDATRLIALAQAGELAEIARRLGADEDEDSITGSIRTVVADLDVTNDDSFAQRLLAMLDRLALALGDRR